MELFLIRGVFDVQTSAAIRCDPGDPRSREVCRYPVCCTARYAKYGVPQDCAMPAITVNHS